MYDSTNRVTKKGHTLSPSQAFALAEEQRAQEAAAAAEEAKKNAEAKQTGPKSPIEHAESGKSNQTTR